METVREKGVEERREVRRGRGREVMKGERC